MSVSVNAAPFNGYGGGIINCSGSGVDHAGVSIKALLLASFNKKTQLELTQPAQPDLVGSRDY